MHVMNLEMHSFLNTVFSFFTTHVAGREDFAFMNSCFQCVKKLNALNAIFGCRPSCNMLRGKDKLNTA